MLLAEERGAEGMQALGYRSIRACHAGPLILRLSTQCYVRGTLPTSKELEMTAAITEPVVKLKG